MTGIIMAAHGKMADGLMDAVELIFGAQENVETHALTHGDDIEGFGQAIQTSINRLDKGQGVIVLTDLFSASPYNQSAIAFHKLQKQNYRLIAGMNLPMLIEVFNQRMIGSDIETIYQTAMETARDGIREFKDELSKVQVANNSF